jgi:hypothetical protein
MEDNTDSAEKTVPEIQQSREKSAAASKRIKKQQYNKKQYKQNQEK